MTGPAPRDHAWLPRATCDMDCLRAGGCGSVPTRDRGAAGRAADQLAAAGGAGAAPARGGATGLVEVEKDLLPAAAVVPRGPDHAVGRADSQSARCAGGQRPHVLAGRRDDRCGASGRPLACVAPVVCRPRRRGGQPRRADDGAHRQGHPDRARQPAPAARRGGHRRGPAVRGSHGGGVPRGHHLVWLLGSRIGARGRSIRRCSRPPSTPADRSSRCGCATSTGTAGYPPCRPTSATTRCCARSVG